MSPTNFLKHLFGTVLKPDERARAQRQARQAANLCRSLMSERGEVSGAALARDALALIGSLPPAALEALFDVLVADFSPDPAAVLAAAEAYRDDPSQEHLIRLQEVVEPPRQELFRRLNMAPGGTAALVAIRQRLLVALGERPEWRGIDADLAHLLASWFNRGFLTLERIDWHTPAIVLEKLIRYEAVHAIKGWGDLHRRLEKDRRCFAFFHPALPDEPLIFIEVALTRGLAASVQPLIEPDAPILDPQSADAAIFYSITNCQDGLRGVSFGNLLIKQVAQELGRELPRLKQFATLSPVPGFRAWLATARESIAATPRGGELLASLKLLERADWYEDAAAVRELEPQLMALCAHYLVNVKRGNEPVDAVARFHLGNGARMERLNWLADRSKAGMQRSAGMMVNYLYRLADVESNHEAYVGEHKVVASAELRRLARDCPLAARSARG